MSVTNLSLSLQESKNSRECGRWKSRKIQRGARERNSWTFKALLLLPQGIAGAATARGSWLIWLIMGAFVLFQQADRKHLGPRGPENSAGPPAPPRCNTSSARRILCRLQTALPGCLRVNKHPSSVHGSSAGEYALSFCFDPRAPKTLRRTACGGTAGSETCLFTRKL